MAMVIVLVILLNLKVFKVGLNRISFYQVVQAFMRRVRLYIKLLLVLNAPTEKLFLGVIIVNLEFQTFLVYSLMVIVLLGLVQLGQLDLMQIKFLVLED